jgi:hypothetical protein
MSSVSQSGAASDFLPESANAHEVSLWRLYLMRGAYLLVALAMGSQIWPLVFHHRPWADVMHSVAVAMLAAVTALCLIGVRYPLQMLPLLMVELFWKSVWLAAIAAPIWLSGGTMDANTRETAQACLWGVIFLVAIPWSYVFTHYVKKPGDRWF